MHTMVVESGAGSFQTKEHERTSERASASHATLSTATPFHPAYKTCVIDFTPRNFPRLPGMSSKYLPEIVPLRRFFLQSPSAWVQIYL